MTNTKSYTYAIGDLHGHFEVAQKVLSVIEEHCGSNQGHFVCCGDFVDRGKNSRGIIDLFKNGPTLPNWKWTILKGNHEDMMYQVLNKRAQLNWWFGNGGGFTLRSYGYKNGDLVFPLKDPLTEHLEWLNNLPVWHYDDYRIFVHAGFDTGIGLYKQSEQNMMWKYDPDDNDYSFMDRHVVCGHVQHADGPILTPNRTNVDTFAWLYGRQAIAVFDDSIPGGPIEILWAEGAPDDRYD